ncbi:MAG: OmpH family outer membrane protein [Desulfobacteraceae bacterium]|nr:MAG: OmpH family outer membrane protein [Desulfobacteraceae bacterium]
MLAVVIWTTQSDVHVISSQRREYVKRNTLLVGMVAGLLLMLYAGSVFAQSVKIGLIDTQKIMRESSAAKKARDILMKDLETKRAQYKAEEDQARRLEEELKNEAQTMTPAARQEKAAKLEKEIKELGRLKSDLEEDFRKKDAELARQILGELSGIVNEYLKKEKLTVVLEKRFVVAADDAIEITDKIIRLYDAKKK